MTYMFELILVITEFELILTSWALAIHRSTKLRVYCFQIFQSERLLSCDIEAWNDEVTCVLGH